MLCLVNNNTLAVVDDVSQADETHCLEWQEDNLQGDLQAGIAWSTPPHYIGGDHRAFPDEYHWNRCDSDSCYPHGLCNGSTATQQ